MGFRGGRLWGGGFILVSDLIPTTTGSAFGREALPVDQAASIAIAASALLQDPDGAGADAARWSNALIANQTVAGNPEYRQARTSFIADEMLGAARLVTGSDLPVSNADAILHRAQNLLRSFGRFKAAYSMCSRIAGESLGEEQLVFSARECAGEAAYLAGDYKAAKSILNAVATDERRSSGIEDVTGIDLEAAQAFWSAGDRESARNIFLRGATSNLAVTSLAKLGDLALDSGQSAQSLAYYDAVVASVGDVHPFDATFPKGSTDNLIQTAQLGQRVYNNRGVARLRNVQKEPGQPPDCAKIKDACRSAQRDFATALAVDPFNPIYRLNAAWVARLLGDDKTARADLDLAVQIDTTLFPAFNDLGILAAQTGDYATARKAFVAALRAAPDYDLATWNLGVLSMSEGGARIPEGQAELARAAQLNPRLRGQPIEFKPDDRIYRILFGASQTSAASWSFNRSYGVTAAVLGSVATVSAAGVLVHNLTGKATGFIEDLARSNLPAIMAFLRARIPRRLRSRRLANAPPWVLPWLFTLPVLVAVTAVTAWAASPEARPAIIAIAVLATALAVLAHEVGHMLAALATGARVTPQAWGPGIGMALLLLPFRLSSGPYVGHVVSDVPAAKAWWVYLAGPAANLILALAAFGLYLARPLPILELVAQIQVTALAFALLPFGSLDGAPVAKRTPHVAAAIGLLVAAAGTAIALITT